MLCGFLEGKEPWRDKLQGKIMEMERRLVGLRNSKEDGARSRVQEEKVRRRPQQRMEGGRVREGRGPVVLYDFSFYSDREPRMVLSRAVK